MTITLIQTVNLTHIGFHVGKQRMCAAVVRALAPVYISSVQTKDEA